MTTVTVTIEIDAAARPIVGTLRATGDPRPVPFTGWVQLNHLLGQLAHAPAHDKPAER